MFFKETQEINKSCVFIVFFVKMTVSVTSAQGGKRCNEKTLMPLYQLRHKTIEVINAVLAKTDCYTILGNRYQHCEIRTIFRAYRRRLRFYDPRKHPGYEEQVRAISSWLRIRKGELKATAQYRLYTELKIFRNGIKPGQKVNIQDVSYQVSSEEGWPWNMCKLQGAKGSSSDKYKVHISLKRTEENIKKSYAVILPILAQYKVTAFKLAHIDQLESCMQSNADGKEYVIYMQRQEGHQENDPDRWIEMLSRIERDLYQAGIMKGNPSQGDVVFPGSMGYIYRRTPHNILGQYIPASFLKKAGFTCNEAANLTADDRVFWRDRLLLYHGTEMIHSVDRVVETTKVNVNDMHAAEKDTVDAIVLQYQKQLIHEDNGLFQLLFNDDEEPLRGSVVHSVAMALYSFNLFLVRGKPKPSIPFCDALFPKVAGVVARIHTLFKGSGEEIRVGWIHPVLYHDIFVPLIEHVTKSNLCIKKIERILRCGTIFDEKELIYKLVKVSLRDPAKNQIQADTPQYIYNLTEEQVEALIVGALRQNREGQNLHLKRKRDLLERKENQGNALYFPSHRMTTVSSTRGTKSSNFIDL